MKTANEWCKENEQAWESGDGEACKLVVVDETVVKQIQLDAMREGMKRAQQVIFDTESPHSMDAQRIVTSIDAAINSLTDQDIAAITGTTLAK